MTTTTTTASEITTPTAPAPPRTVLPVKPELAAPERRTSTATLRATDLYAVVGALLASLSLTAILFQFLVPFDGPLGFVVCTYVGFLVCYSLLVSFDES